MCKLTLTLRNPALEAMPDKKEEFKLVPERSTPRLPLSVALVAVTLAAATLAAPLTVALPVAGMPATMGSSLKTPIRSVLLAMIVVEEVVRTKTYPALLPLTVAASLW